MRYEAKNGKTNNEISNGNGTEKYKYDQFAVDDDQNGGLDSEKSDTGVKMERSLGLISGTAIIAGTMIGSGIFVSPRGVLYGAGSVGMSMVIWLACGILSMFGALTYAELGSTIPLSGAEHAYFMEAFCQDKKRRNLFGRIPAFLFDWICIFIIRTTMFAGMCFTLGTYVTQPFYPDCAPPLYLTKLVTAIAMVILCFINCMSIKFAEKIQMFMMAVKLVAAVIIVAGGCYSLSQGDTETLASGFEGTSTDTAMLVLSFYNGLWAYDGWNNLNFVTEELKNPKKNIPRAICIALPLVMIVYLSINVGYFAVLPKQEILSSDAVAVLWGKRILGVMQWIMPMFVICSCFGSANGSLFSSGRLSYVAARDGHLPSGISFLHVQRHTPIPSMIFTLTLSTLLIIPFDLGALIGIFSFTSWIFYGVSAATVLLLRYRNRHKKLDSYKVPVFIPILVILLSTFLVLVPLIYLPKPEYKYVVLFMAVGLCIYFLFVYRKIKVPFVDSATRLMQKLLVVVPPSQEKKLLD
ncbi:solute carrier family 7 (L-type amino acid transporter), member 9 [Mytilus galloprovincialis]|uniref:b(0,+)-type amino acid transporter 1 n=1 Tax=Mytilus galloprovincialis TaxID=29158 RepID=A0A8B6DES5_MYTGA|nr:solute carrier family 7 (L-type amino acid transporter), member 9 [Mytilus galloprovincialis]